MSKVPAEVAKELKSQGSYQALLREMKAQQKKVMDEIKAIKDKIPSMIFNKKRITIGEKGSVLFYGLNKQFPVSLYKNQLVELKQILNSPEFNKWFKENESLMSEKSKEETEEKAS